MGWLLPSVTASAIGVMLLTFIYIYLYLHDRSQVLFIWAAGWFLYFLRFVFMILILNGFDVPIMFSTSQILSVASGLLLLTGTLMRLDKRIENRWMALAVFAAIWSLVTNHYHADMGVSTVVPFIVLGIMFIRIGVAFLRQKDAAIRERRLIGITFILWGIHKLDYPLLRPIEWAAPYGYAVGAALAVMASAGLLLYHFRLVRQELDESRSQFRDLIENMPVLLDAFDEDGNVVLWNRECERVTGIARSEAIGSPDLLKRLYPDPEKCKSLRASLKKHDSDFRDTELTLTTADGDKRIISWSNISESHPIPGFAMWAVGKDVTARVRAEEALREAKLSAEAATRAKSEFLANMSHEIRTPLNGALGMLQLLLRTDLDDDQRELAETGMQSCRNLTQLLSDILDISRMEAGKLILRNKPFSIRAIMAEMETIFRTDATNKGLELRFVVEDSVPETLLGDEVRTRQLLMNLVGNAVKFTETGSVTTVVRLLREQKDGKERIAFSIVDTGIGIPEEQLEKIFEPFTQAEGGLTRTHQGVGLGLGIVKRIIKALGGTLCMNSVLAEGTEVIFTLDYGHADQQIGEEPEVEHDQPVPEHVRILLAEDDRVNRLATSRMIEHLGWRVETAENGEEAVGKALGSSYDCVLMDIQMPRMDGLEAARTLRKKDATSRLPIIALTAHAMQADQEAALEAGMNGYLAKPVDMGELRETVLRVVDRKG